MEYKAEQLLGEDTDENNNTAMLRGFILTSLRVTKDIFGEKAAPYVRAERSGRTGNL